MIPGLASSCVERLTGVQSLVSSKLLEGNFFVFYIWHYYIRRQEKKRIKSDFVNFDHRLLACLLVSLMFGFRHGTRVVKIRKQGEV